MSGIVGIVNLDDAPADRELLQKMTRALAFRGPDGIETWCSGGVGFGHTLLRTTDEAAHEHQPTTLDGQVWIVGDVRVDGRTELIMQLEKKGEHPTPLVTDPELILQCLSRDDTLAAPKRDRQSPEARTAGHAGRVEPE